MNRNECSASIGIGVQHGPEYAVPRVAVCGHCTNALNSYREVAQSSYSEIGDRLERGMRRRLENASQAHKPIWQIEEALKALANFEAEYEAALDSWIKKLLADTKNTSRIYKIIRAERRGLLHYDRPKGWGYPNNWVDVAAKIRAIDNYTCVNCKVQGVELHVHHIVYVSNFGTHRKQNLVTLCRECHEAEHQTVFDFGEAKNGLDEVPDSPLFSDDSDICSSQSQHEKSFLNQNMEPQNWEVLDYESSVIALEQGSGDLLYAEYSEIATNSEQNLTNTLLDDELVDLKQGILDGEEFTIIQTRIERVKNLYNLTDDKLVSKMSKLSDSFVMEVLHENIGIMDLYEENHYLIEDLYACLTNAHTTSTDINKKLDVINNKKICDEEIEDLFNISFGVDDSAAERLSRIIMERALLEHDTTPDYRPVAVTHIEDASTWSDLIKNGWPIVILTISFIFFGVRGCDQGGTYYDDNPANDYIPRGR